ncbi:MAG TPA: FAD-dependent oxidoreductase, partial [Salinimicrobium sp.]|nr:FAD-dependent oxidoreductase [Salinimicrobium sp.]
KGVFLWTVMEDYIIVGYGLAGAAVSFELEERGSSFSIFENASQSSSKVAGGIANPVILKRLKLAWNADLHFQQAEGFYRKVEKKLGQEIYYNLEIYRKFFSVEEQNDWFEAADKPLLKPFLDTDLVRHLSDGIPSSFSFGRVLGTMKLDTEKYLEASMEYFRSMGNLIDEGFIYDDLILNSDFVQYRGRKARNIIFCEGFGMRQNPYFNYLPLRGNKGEYIIIRAPQLKLKSAVKSSVFILPLGDNLYKVGATYDNRSFSPEITLEARKNLIARVNEMITVPYEVMGQVAGIRPVSADRRPLIGQHPKYTNLYCCNGFGSRGVIASPAISKQLIESIEDSESIPPEADIARFKKRWLKSN